MIRLIILLFIFLSSPDYIFSQELDDMYFTTKDRNIKKIKKTTPADVILSKYRSGYSEINGDKKISDEIINKYIVSNSRKLNPNISKNRDNLKSLKFNRDELFRSSYFDKKFLDFNSLMLFNMVQPNYYSFIDPYYSPFSNNLFSFYDYRWMPRSLNGIRKLAAYDPLMFFSNPYLSSYYPMMSPSLWNFHHPSFSTYGCSILNSTTYPSWIWTNNGTGGGLQNTLANHHMYFSSYVNNENSKTVVKGPRSGRGSSFNGENISDILPADRYLGRRASGITNKNVQRGISNNDPLDQSQNAYFRGRSSENTNYSTRSSRSNSIQNSDRRSISNQNRTFNSRVNALNDTFSNNSLRSNRGNNISDYNSTNSGRRASYSQPSNYGSNRSGIFSSSASNNNSSSGIGSRSGNSSSSSFSGRSSSFSSGSSSSGGGSSSSTVSGGSSGGSSRGGNN